MPNSVKLPAIKPAAPIRVSFRQASEAIVPRLAQLFEAHVLLLDEQHVVVASSEPEEVGAALRELEQGGFEGELWVPLGLFNQAAEIVIGELPPDGAIAPRLAQAIVELTINDILAGKKLPTQQQVKDKLIYDLLHGYLEDEDEVLCQAGLLGLDLALPRAVILIDAADYILLNHDGNEAEVDNQIQYRAQMVISRVVDYFHLPSDMICAYLGRGQVAVLKASDRRNLADWADEEGFSTESGPSWADLAALKRASKGLLDRLPPGSNGARMSIGIGRYHPGLSGLRRSYYDALMALSLGKRFCPTKRAYCLDELGIPAFVAHGDEQIKLELATYLLGPLDGEPELLETLRVFFAQDCCNSAAAAVLHIHRNTLNYRLEKITSLTGLDPRHFDDGVQMRLALLLRSATDRPRPEEPVASAVPSRKPSANGCTTSLPVN